MRLLMSYNILLATLIRSPITTVNLNIIRLGYSMLTRDPFFMLWTGVIMSLMGVFEDLMVSPFHGQLAIFLQIFTCFIFENNMAFYDKLNALKKYQA